MQKKMRAVRLFAPGDVRCVETETPGLINPDDVIVQVKSCGVCGSDIQRVMVKGAYRHPITIGHEFSGTIVETGPGVKTPAVGDGVTVMPLIPCGKCEYCKIGNYVLCEDYTYYGSRIDGAMAQYIRVSAPNVLKLPPNVDYETGSMTDPAAVALHAVSKARILPGQTAVVFGLGPIGLFALQWLKLSGCGEVIAVDVYDEKLNIAADLGATLVIHGHKQDPVHEIRSATDGRGTDLAIDLAGNKVTQVQVIESVKKMGTVVYCGISYEDLSIPNSVLNMILRRELTLKGAWNSSCSI
jgi:L-iditol 2-dehydrogenase